MRALSVSAVLVLAPLAGCGGDPASNPGADAGEDASGSEDGGADAAIDAPAIDALVIDPPQMCGTETCRAGETCDQGTCMAPSCGGAAVPGDYATIQAAATALAAAGADATICLGNRVYPAPASGNAIFINDPDNHGATLRIVGQGRDRSRITGRFSIGRGWGTVTFEGVEITAPTAEAILIGEGQTPDVEVLASRLRGPTGIEALQRVNLRVEGTVFAVSTYGLSLLHSSSTGGPMRVRVENSVFRDDGVAIRANSTYAGKMFVTVVGSTFRGVDHGIRLGDVALGGDITATISSSIFTDISQRALAWTVDDTVTHTRNALWGNGVNYFGVASAGVGYVTQDCLLTPASPAPGLAASSPCRDAGDPAHATTHDFYGVARGSLPDIGAVEAP